MERTERRKCMAWRSSRTCTRERIEKAMSKSYIEEVQNTEICAAVVLFVELVGSENKHRNIFLVIT